MKRKPTVLLGGIFLLCTFVLLLFVEPSISNTLGISNLADDLWRAQALRKNKNLSRKYQSVTQQLETTLQKTPGAPSLLQSSEPKPQWKSNYQRLPEVYSDQNSGYVFPQPLEAPLRFSWYQIKKIQTILQSELEDLTIAAQYWKKLPPKKRLETFPELEQRWQHINQIRGDLSLRIRYLNDWIPKLLQHQAGIPAELAEELEKSLRDKNTQWQKLRKYFRPYRIVPKSFLPDVLQENQTLVIPIATDITSKAFLAEFENAIEIHWNRSSWATQKKIRFKIQWIPLPTDQDFAQGKKSLTEHLEGFPKEVAGLTTGGGTTFTRKNVMALGPATITLRTLAHEFGHLLGFPDCYFRSLKKNGIKGLEVSEWKNPVFPEELMCDDTIGALQAISWETPASL